MLQREVKRVVDENGSAVLVFGGLLCVLVGMLLGVFLFAAVMDVQPEQELYVVTQLEIESVTNWDLDSDGDVDAVCHTLGDNVRCRNAEGR